MKWAWRESESTLGRPRVQPSLLPHTHSFLHFCEQDATAQRCVVVIYACRIEQSSVDFVKLHKYKHFKVNSLRKESIAQAYYCTSLISQLLPHGSNNSQPPAQQECNLRHKHCQYTPWRSAALPRHRLSSLGRKNSHLRQLHLTSPQTARATPPKYRTTKLRLIHHRKQGHT